VKIKWSPEFAYAIGLIVSDGNLSPDGRHICFTSKDLELVKIFSKCLGINRVISKKASGSTSTKKYFRVQFGDVLLYRFLESIGLTPNKSKTIGELKIPSRYFFDFLRGHFDGDGTFYSYFDPRWRSSFMFYTILVSASEAHINWLRKRIFDSIGIKGHITKNTGEHILFQLKYAKRESSILIKKMYPKKRVFCLTRKKLKIAKALSTIGEHL
jgi:hypothetical protein